ncbi:hypothetical protein EWM64_g9974 [Hericium alpestre]|uniref:ATPase inhibitor, mitochondrial n=1 Tax=Hericium alpestre TaxID=135208 RepID=A0A4Y9ZK65_9AGAM|nr:hypothetical protein EWM64_g9974 [Hericium alpestre]
MLSRVALTAPRRLTVAALSARTYTTSSKEGSVAQSREFGKREKAQEDVYARAHEREQIEKLKKEIEKKQAQLEELEKKSNNKGPEH